MPGDLQVNVVRRDRFRSRPTGLDDVREFLGDVNAPTVAPAVLKPPSQFRAGVVVEHVHVQFALVRQARQGQVAAAEEPDCRIHRIGPEEEVKFCMESVAQEQLDDDLLGLDLCRQAPQARFVLVGGNAGSQLVAELLGQTLLESQGRLVVHPLVAPHQTHGRAQFLLRQPLHPHEQAAAVPFAAGPSLDQ